MPTRRGYRNTGWWDRGLRLVAGVMVLGLYGALDPPWKFLTLIGLPLIATGLSGFCPLYALLGIGTRKPPSKT